jgi:hypothetical protein
MTLGGVATRGTARWQRAAEIFSGFYLGPFQTGSGVRLVIVCGSASRFPTKESSKRPGPYPFLKTGGQEVQGLNRIFTRHQV